MMSLHWILLPLTLAVSLAGTYQYSSPVDSTLHVTVRGEKDAHNNWKITVDTRRITSPDNQYELAVNVFQKMSYLNSSDIRHVVLLTSVHPPVHEVEPVTTSTTTPSTSTTQKPKSCPHPEYKQFEDFNCYKGYVEKKKWIDARHQCKRDGGDLMVLESAGERNEVFPTMYKIVKKDQWLPWMGVYKDIGDNSWVSVTGEPALTDWWEPKYPDNILQDQCATATEAGLLYNVNCNYNRTYICEIALKRT